MSSSIQAAAIDTDLTDFASGVANDVASALANFIAPEVVVPTSIGRFKQFNNKQAFQVYSTDRAVGAPANRIQFDANTSTYNCKPQALEIGVDDAERLATVNQGIPIDDAKVRTLIVAASLSHEDRVFAAVKNSVTAVSSVGVWSNSSNDPVKEINAQIESIATATGMMPNRIVFGLGAWRVFQDHPLVIARQPGAQLIGLSTDGAARMVLNPSIDIRIGVFSKDTTKFGAAKNVTNLVGAEVFIFYASASPDIYDPSFAKTFTTHSNGVAAVRSYRDERSRSTVHAVDWSEDIQIVSTESVRRLTIS